MDPFQVANSLLSHSCCNLLYPRISRFSLSSSSRVFRDNFIKTVSIIIVGLGGLGVTWSSRDSRFAGSNPSEVGFFLDVKILSTSPPGGTLSHECRVWNFTLVKKPQAWKNKPLSKIPSMYSRASNNVFHILLAHEAMDLSSIILPPVENKY